MSSCDSHLLTMVIQCVIFFKVCTNDIGPSVLGYFRKKWQLQGSRSGNEKLISGWHLLVWMKEKRENTNKRIHGLSWRRGCFLAVPVSEFLSEKKGEKEDYCIRTSVVCLRQAALQRCSKAQHTALPARAKCFRNWFIDTFLSASIREVHWFYLNSF